MTRIQGALLLVVLGVPLFGAPAAEARVEKDAGPAVGLLALPELHEELLDSAEYLAWDMRAMPEAVGGAWRRAAIPRFSEAHPDVPGARLLEIAALLVPEVVKLIRAAAADPAPLVALVLHAGVSLL